MESLKYTIISTTTKNTNIYIHKEEQTYRKQRKTKDGYIFKCTFSGCNCTVKRVNHNFYRVNSKWSHKHVQNSERATKEKIKRVLATRILERILISKGEIELREAHQTVAKKLGKMEMFRIRDIKKNLTGETKTKCTGTFITVQPVHLIPLSKIQLINKKTKSAQSEFHLQLFHNN